MDLVLRPKGDRIQSGIAILLHYQTTVTYRKCEMYKINLRPYLLLYIYPPSGCRQGGVYDFTQQVHTGTSPKPKRVSKRPTTDDSRAFRRVPSQRRQNSLLFLFLPCARRVTGTRQLPKTRNLLLCHNSKRAIAARARSCHSALLAVGHERPLPPVTKSASRTCTKIQKLFF